MSETRAPLAAPLPPTTMESYGLTGHLPRCRAVLLMRVQRVTDESRCDCGKSGPDALRPVPPPFRMGRGE